MSNSDSSPRLLTQGVSDIEERKTQDISALEEQYQLDPQLPTSPIPPDSGSLEMPSPSQAEASANQMPVREPLGATQEGSSIPPSPINPEAIDAISGENQREIEADFGTFSLKGEESIILVGSSINLEKLEAQLENKDYQECKSAECVGSVKLWTFTASKADTSVKFKISRFFNWDWLSKETECYSLDPEFDHHFIFHSIQGDQQKNLNDWMIYFAMWAVKNEFNSTIPQLVIQFRRKLISTWISHDQNLFKQFYESLRTFLTNMSSISPRLVACVVGLLGALEPLPVTPDFEPLYGTLLNQQFVEYLLAAPASEFTKMIILEVSHMITRKDIGWKGTLQAFQEYPDFETSLWEQFSTKFNHYSLNEEEIQQWVEAVPGFSPDLATKCLWKLLERTHDFAIWLTILEKLSHEFLEEQDEKRVLVSRLSSQFTLDASSIIVLLDLLQNKPPEFKKLIYRSSIPWKLSNFIDKPTFEYAKIYERLISTDFDDEMLYRPNFEKLFSNFLSCREFTFSSILSIFKQRNAQQLYRKYLICKATEGEILALAESQLHGIEDTGIVREYSRIAVELFFMGKPRLNTLVWIAQSLDCYSVQSIKEEFLCFWGKSDHKSYNNTELLRFADKYQHNETVEKMVDIMLDATDNITSREFEGWLIENPENGYNRIYRLENISTGQRFAVKKYARQVVEGANAIIAKQITIGKLKQIDSQSEIQRNHYLAVINRASSLLQQKNNFSPTLCDRLSEMKEKINDLKLHIDFLQQLNIQAYSSLMQQCMQDYQTCTLADFNSPLPAPLIEIVNSIRPFIKSEIYWKVFDRAALNDDPETLRDLCEQAKEVMLSSLSPVLSTIDKERLMKIATLFENVADWKNEMSIYQEIFPNCADKVEVLSEVLRFYYSRDERKSMCKALEGLKDSLRLRADAELAQARKYISSFDNQGELTISAFRKISKKTEQLVFPKQNTAVYQILTTMNESSDFFTFLAKNLDLEKINVMLQCVNDQDESILNTKLILDLRQVFTFYQSLAHKSLSYEKLLDEIAMQISNPDYKDMQKMIVACNAQLVTITELNLSHMSRETEKNEQIKNIYRKAILTFVKVNEAFDVELYYGSQSPSRVTLSLILELKERASLSIRSSQKDDESILSILHSFLQFAHRIQEVIRVLNELSATGHPKDFTTQSFQCKNGSCDSLILFYDILRSELLSWNSLIEDAYSSCYPLTFFFGNQFWTLERHFHRPEESSIEAEHLLLFLGRIANRQATQALDGSSPTERLRQLSQILCHLQPNEQMKSIKCDQSFGEKILVEPGGVLYRYSQHDALFQALLSVYVNSGKPFPHAYQVLYCRADTLWAELNAFLYRCFTCPEAGTIFTLMSCEFLSLQMQTEFRDLFIKVEEKFTDSKCIFAIITSDENCLLADFFRSLDTSIRVRDSQMVNNSDISSIIKRRDEYYSSETILVYSDFAGMGKSSWIKRQAAGTSLVHFPIAGELNLSDICKLFFTSIRDFQTLHINLSHVDNSELLEELLMSLSFMRCLSARCQLVTIPNSCKIYIEVANLQPPFRPQYLDFLPAKHRVIFDINELDVNADTDFVCSYLELYHQNQLDDEPRPVSRERAIFLLQDHFIATQNQRISFISVASFIKTMKYLINSLEQSICSVGVIRCMIEDLRAEASQRSIDLCDLIQEYERLRHGIFEGFLDSTSDVITRSVNSVRSEQRSADREESEFEMKCSLTWQDTAHFCIVFDSVNSIIPIYRIREKVPEAFQRLMFIQANCQKMRAESIMKLFQSQKYQIEDYSAMNSEELLGKLKTYCKPGYNLKEECKQSAYVITPDNFLKMNLIYLRAQAKLPIVIMGETGCGKTSLIRFFVEKALNETLKVISIHAGITSAILANILQPVFAEANAAIATASNEIQAKKSVSNEEAEREAEEKAKVFWVFFDEFNTSHCVGQICQIMCEKHFNGVPVPNNIVWLAACNPYRLRSKKIVDSAGIIKSRKNATERKLMHLVKPLPETAIEYIWDFGALTDIDSKKYIIMMLKSIEAGRYYNLFVELVYASQQYFKGKEDVSSVSLRDVARFRIMFTWFKESITSRKALKSSQFKSNEKKYKIAVHWEEIQDIELAAGILALQTCYYFRISGLEERKAFLLMLSQVSSGVISISQMEQVNRTNENDWIARMELPKATALNQAFRENVTCILHCIFMKVPLFICGKPGCSKSLAIQTVFANCRGRYSSDIYLQQLPELIMVPFQGSESCTSEGVLKVFEKANKYFTNASEGVKILPVVIFDEIGLAEISKHNPLKVLHSLLEVEKQDIGFVGVSNWRLDASKMNRAIYLARPDPDNQDLTLTAEQIYQSCNPNPYNDRHKIIICSLASAYCQLKYEMRDSLNADFYGLRDFYWLIKHVASELIRRKTKVPIEQAAIVKQAIERNFSGTTFGARRLGEIMQTQYPQFKTVYDTIPTSNTIDLIKANLLEPEARFLMIICSSDLATNTELH